MKQKSNKRVKCATKIAIANREGATVPMTTELKFVFLTKLALPGTLYQETLMYLYRVRGSARMTAKIGLNSMTIAQKKLKILKGTVKEMSQSMKKLPILV